MPVLPFSELHFREILKQRTVVCRHVRAGIAIEHQAFIIKRKDHDRRLRKINYISEVVSDRTLQLKMQVLHACGRNMQKKSR